jgi:putative ABC transport system permease protein
MLRHYLSLALRNFRRSPAAATLNVFTLALGLVCFLIVAGTIGFWERADHQFPKTSRTYVVTSTFDFADGSGPGRSPLTSDYVARYLKADFPQIEAVARTVQVNANASYVSGDRSARLAEYGADAELLDILDLPFIEGDAHNALKSPLSVVLREEAARKLFGAERALGKHVLLGGVWDATVTGVIGKIPEPTHLGHSAFAFGFDALSSRDVYEDVFRVYYGSDPTTGPENWRSLGNVTYVLLPADGSLTAEQLRAQLPAFLKRHVPAEQLEHFKLELGLVPLGNLLVWLSDGITGNRGPSVPSILWVLGSLVLAVACVNYANLAIGRATFRARDIGVRKALGASTTQVLAQSFVESALLTIAALALAFAVTALLAPTIAAVTGMDLRLALLVDARSWAWTIAVALVVTGVAGALPAIALARLKPAFALHGGVARLGPRTISTWLVGVQFFVTSVLLIGMAVSYEQNQRLQRTGLASNSDPLIVVDDYAKLTHVPHETLHTELLRVPGVKAETAMSVPPWIGADGQQVKRTPQEADKGQFALLYGVADEFFATFDIPVLAGRALDSTRGDAPPKQTNEEQTSPQRVVIDRELASALGFATPQAAVGEILYGVRPGFGRLEIVGVVENRRLNIMSFGGAAMHNLYTLNADPIFHVVRIAKDDVAATITNIDALWKRLVPTMAPNRRFIDDYFNDTFELYLRLSQSFFWLATFTLLIATIGLFAMALFVVARRRREIAVRKVLGARTQSIVSLLLRSFVLPVLLASVLAWPIAYLAARAYLTQFADPIALTAWPFIACLLFTLAIAVFAVGAQTLRAARPPPAGALRTE